MEKKSKEVVENVVKIYEIGYLLVSSLTEEKVVELVESLKDILSKRGAEAIAEGAPELRKLSYTMSKKIGSLNHKFDEGYFGWFKFGVSAGEIEIIKKSFEENPNMLRMLVIGTVRENTYLGKKSPITNPESQSESTTESVVESPKGIVTPTLTSVEEMDKSIDAMVKEAQ